MYKAARRTSPEVLKEILSTGPATKSSIRFTVGLSHSQAQRYLPYLITEGFLQIDTDDKGRIYESSPKGRRLLQRLNELSQMMDTDL